MFGFFTKLFLSSLFFSSLSLSLSPSSVVTSPSHEDTSYTLRTIINSFNHHSAIHCLPLASNSRSHNWFRVLSDRGTDLILFHSSHLTSTSSHHDPLSLRSHRNNTVQRHRAPAHTLAVSLGATHVEFTSILAPSSASSTSSLPLAPRSHRRTHSTLSHPYLHHLNLLFAPPLAPRIWQQQQQQQPHR